MVVFFASLAASKDVAQSVLLGILSGPQPLLGSPVAFMLFFLSLLCWLLFFSLTFGCLRDLRITHLISFCLFSFCCLTALNTISTQVTPTFIYPGRISPLNSKPSACPFDSSDISPTSQNEHDWPLKTSCSYFLPHFSTRQLLSRIFGFSNNNNNNNIKQCDPGESSFSPIFHTAHLWISPKTSHYNDL